MSAFAYHRPTIDAAAPQVHVRHGPNYDTMHKARTTLGEYVTHALQPLGDDRYYCSNNSVPPELVPYLCTPSLLEGGVFDANDTSMWLGSQGTGVHLHRDMLDNFLVHVFGRKRFIVASPADTRHLYVTAPAALLLLLSYTTTTTTTILHHHY